MNVNNQKNMLNNEPKACIIYHKDDNDGVFSGAIMAMYYYFTQKIKDTNIKFIGADYNDLKSYNEDTINELFKEYKYLTITDISLPIELLKYTYNLYGDNLIWIDHHAPIIDAAKKANIADKIQGTLDPEHSALYHAWQWFYHAACNNKNCRNFHCLIEMPDILDILSQWDSFTFEPEIKEYCQKINRGATYLFKLNLQKIWIRLMSCINFPGYWEELYNQCEENGEILLNDEYNRMDDLVERCGDMTWILKDDDNEFNACALFIQGPTNSTIFRMVSDEVKVGLVFKRNADATWAVSAYHTDTKYDTEFHIGNWCRKKYNGGGHAGAGGFIISEEQFIEALKTKII